MKKKNIFYVYIHRKKDSGEIFYVGKGSKGRYFTSNQRSKMWKDIVKKHGLTAGIIFSELFEWEAFQLEMFFIKEIGRRDLRKGPLINFTDGGEGVSGHVHSEETRKKLSESHKGKKSSKETRKKLSKIHKGEKNHLFGKHLSEETKKKISNTLIGHIESEETKKKKSMSHTGEKHYLFGKHVSEEIKTKIANTLKGKYVGKKSPSFGKCASEETKKKLSESHLKLTFEQAEKIRELFFGKNYSRKAIANMFSIAISTVNKIIKNEIYNK